MRLRLVALPGALALAVLPLPLRAQRPARGRIFDTYTRAPLAGVQVVGPERRAVVSGDDGTFTIACTPPMTLQFRRLGYESYSTAVSDCDAPLLIGLSPGTQNLNAVSVVATRDAPTLRQPVSVTTVPRVELTRSTGLFLDDVLNTVPSVRMERRTMSGGQRITIRGYGNSTNFDGTGYKAYLNGVPITDAEGVTILDDVDFATLGKVDVIRGPASSLYGAGIGGVVQLYTLRPLRPGNAIEQDVLTGADGLLRSDTRFSSVSNASTILLNYGHQGYDSYRVHSASRKDHALFLGDFRPSDRRTITAFLTYAHSYEERAGQMDSAQFFTKQNVGESRYLDNDGHVDMESIRAGVTHAYRLSERVEPVMTAYFSAVDREDVFAVGVNPRSAYTFGTRAVLNTRFPAGDRVLTGITGIEFEKTNQFAKGYPLTSGVQGGIRTDLETHSMQYSVFSQWDVPLPSSLTLTAGASLNFIEYAIADRLANSANPTHQDASGRKVYDPVLTPHLALHKMLGDDHAAYVSISEGFTPATSSDAVIPFTGEPNAELEPERGTQVEVGLKGSLFSDRLSYQAAWFNLRVRDKLTSQSVFDDQGTQLYSYTVNAGDQSNRGAELYASLRLLDAPAGPLVQLRPFLSYTYADFTYTDFKSDANNNAGTVSYDGNAVVGVPKTAYTLGADATLRGGGYVTATAEHRGSMPITYDNLHRAPGYTVVSAKAGIRRDLTSQLGLDVHAGVQNLTGELYHTMVFLNADFSDPARPPKIYLPGPYSARPFVGVRLFVRP